MCLVVLHETGELFDRRNVVLPEYMSFARTSRNRSKDQAQRRDRCRDRRRARLTFEYAVLPFRTELSKAATVMKYMGGCVAARFCGSTCGTRD